MRLLFIGDIFAAPGRRMVATHLQRLISEERIDLTIANGENSAGGFGITPSIAQELFSLGVEVITTGNHVWDKREVYDWFEREPRLLRPANYPDPLPGRGLYLGKTRAGLLYAVMNLQGRVHMASIDCPFRKADELIARIPEDVKVRFLDFHAEATSEKVAMGWHVDGRVSAMVGTHTHIPTADARLLPKGTAYQTDSGMTGPYESVIGVEREAVIHRFFTQLPVRFEAAKGWAELRGVIVDIDESSGRSTGIRPLAVLDQPNA
jgi:metallophosphoesterase (TIGR00282 family)